MAKHSVHATTLIADTLKKLDGVDIEPQAKIVFNALSKHYDIRPKLVQPVEAPAPAVGQMWRNKKTDRLVRITDVVGMGSYEWEALTGRGPKTGRGWKGYWTDRFEFVPESDEVNTEAEATRCPRAQVASSAT